MHLHHPRKILLIEGEPPCEDSYVDEFNGGCTSDSQLFTPISFGDTICGESGVFLDGFDEIPDMDWYELTVIEPTKITWSAKAQFRPRLWIYDAAGGCPGNPLASNSALECADLTISADVDPGTYWLVIHPNGFADTAACPSS